MPLLCHYDAITGHFALPWRRGVFSG